MCFINVSNEPGKRTLEIFTANYLYISSNANDNVLFCSREKGTLVPFYFNYKVEDIKKMDKHLIINDVEETLISNVGDKLSDFEILTTIDKGGYDFVAKDRSKKRT